MPVTAEERRFLLDQVNQQASNDLRALWGRMSELGTAEFAALMVDAFPRVVDPYVAISSSLAAHWFELSAPQSSYIAVTAPPVEAAQLTSSAEWALGAPGDKALDRMEGTLQRAVFDGARDTITINVERTGSRWIRHARADACAFCRMLAQRGAVFRSAGSATNVGDGGRIRGTRTPGDKFHDHCHCVSVEIREGQDLYDVVDSDYLNRIDQWEAEYKQAFADVPDGDTGGVKSVMAAWRKRNPGIK